MIHISFHSAEKKTSRGSLQKFHANSVSSLTFPAHGRGGLVLFLSQKSDQNATAASDAMKGSARAGVVIAAPAKAEDRLGRVCERTLCGGFGISFFYSIILLSLRGGTTKQSLWCRNNHGVASLRSQ